MDATIINIDDHHQEQGVRSVDAPDAEQQPVALWHEGLCPACVVRIDQSALGATKISMPNAGMACLE